jgi:hypothetical protein
VNTVKRGGQEEGGGGCDKREGWVGGLQAGGTVVAIARHRSSATAEPAAVSVAECFRVRPSGPMLHLWQVALLAGQYDDRQEEL